MFLNSARASALMGSNGLDGLVVTTQANLRYVSNFGGTGYALETFAVLPRSPSTPPTLGAGHRSLVLLAANPTWMPNLVTFEQVQFANIFPQPGDSADRLLPITPKVDSEIRRLLKEAHKAGTDNPVEALARTLKDLRLDKARLGFDDMNVAYRLREEYLRDLQIVPAAEIMFQIRLVKTGEEIKHVRHAAQVNQQALQEAYAVARAGVDVAAVVAAYKTAVTQRGAIPARQGFLTGSLEAVLWEQLHRALKKGDVFASGGLTSYNSYNSDFGRSVVVGQATPKQKQAHKIVQAAFTGLTPLIRPGLRTSELFKSVEKSAAQAGADEKSLGIYCHAIGQEVLELAHPARHDPRREGFVLEPGVTFCIYVMYRMPETRELLAAEEQYIVTEAGHDSLCTLPLEIIEVG